MLISPAEKARSLNMFERSLGWIWFIYLWQGAEVNLPSSCPYLAVGTCPET